MTPFVTGNNTTVEVFSSSERHEVFKVLADLVGRLAAVALHHDLTGCTGFPVHEVDPLRRHETRSTDPLESQSVKLVEARVVTQCKRSEVTPGPVVSHERREVLVRDADADVHGTLTLVTRVPPVQVH